MFRDYQKWRKQHHENTMATVGTKFVKSNTMQLIVLFLQSTFYNQNISFGYCLRSIFRFILAPFIYFIDHYMKYCGPIFVVIASSMLSLYVLIAYFVGIPYWYNRSPTVLIIASLIGHWLLINVLWNYFNALLTCPGYPTEKAIVNEVVGFCKKCIAPKPARTHHCSICQRCVLKMDHHCPWLNVCIGHRNHRYYIFFCAYTWLGTIFVILFGVWVMIDHFFPHYSPFNELIYHDANMEFIENVYNVLGIFELNEVKIRRACIIYEGLVAGWLFILLGLLLCYHVRLINNGETYLERYINLKAQQIHHRYRRHYHNPYDLGTRENWRNFLGFDRNRWPWLHILWPSSFPPDSDGFSWRTFLDGI